MRRSSLTLMYDTELGCSVNFLKATYTQTADVKQNDVDTYKSNCKCRSIQLCGYFLMEFSESELHPIFFKWVLWKYKIVAGLKVGESDKN